MPPLPSPVQPGLIYVVSGKVVHALDRGGGQTIWERKLGGSFWKGNGLATITADGSEVFVGRNGSLYCLDAACGEVLWERKLGSGASLVVVAMPGGGQATVLAAAAGLQRAAGGK